MKIVLYGVTNIELRRNVEFFLDEDCEIIGYSDTYYTSDVLDRKLFFPLAELHRQEMDYVLILANSPQILADMRTILSANGVSEDKIIEPSVFLGRRKGELDLVEDIRRNYRGEQGLLFGLSYTNRDIERVNLALPFYDCAGSGLDLYYNYRIFQFIKTHKFYKTVTHAFLVFPYYYFDYDVSLSKRQYESGSIFLVRQLKDWHNAEQIPGIRNYIVGDRLFGKKTSQYYHTERFECKSPSIWQGEDGEGELDKIWFRNYEKSVIENKLLLLRFLRELGGAEVALIVPPVYLKGINPASRDAFEQRKKKFYQILGEVQGNKRFLDIYDYADIFAERREFFWDITHLNSNGAREFTERINRDILR